MKYRLMVIAVLVAVAGAVHAQGSCSSFTYQVTPGYDFKGIIKFDYLDMDVQQGGIQNFIITAPGQRVTAQVRWTFGTSCPECTFFINVFGSWEPGKEIAKLYSGTTGSAPSISIVPLSFEAPKTGGEYVLRVISVLGEGYAGDYQALNILKSACTQDRHVFFLDGLVNVTAIEGGLLEVKITRPTSPTGVAEATLGESVLINGTIRGNASKVTLYINEKNMTGTLPFIWNTTNESEGVHVITLEALGLGNTSSKDEIKVELVNLSASGVQPLRLWVNILDSKPSDLDLSGDGKWIVVGGENYLSLYNSEGVRAWKKNIQGAPKVALSRDGAAIATAVGREIKYYSRQGVFLWNYTLPRDADDVVLTASGFVVAPAGRELSMLDNGTLLWNTSLEDSITRVAPFVGDSIVAVAKNRVYAITNESKTAWTYQTPGLIGAVAASSRGSVVISSGKDMFYLTGNGTLSWSFLAPALVSSISVSQDGRHIAAASDRTVFLFEDNEVRGSYQLREPVTSLRLSSDGALLMAGYGNSLSMYQNFEPGRGGFAALMDPKVLLLLAALAIVGAYAYMWNKKKAEMAKRALVGKGGEKGVNFEAVSQGMSLFKHVKVRVEVKNASTKKPVIKALVGIGNRSMETDVMGTAVFGDVPKGTYDLLVDREFYSAVKEKVDLREQEERIQINLTPVSGLGAAYVSRLKEARSAINENYLSVPASDPCLPVYYKTIGEKVIDFAETTADIPALFKKVNYEEVLEDLVFASELICRELGEVIVDWKNIKIYERGSGADGECAAPDFKGITELEEALQDPEKFVETQFPQVRRRLRVLDDEITSRIKDITIMPIAGVWRISEKLMEMTTVKKGAAAPSQLKIAIFTFFADAVLDYVEGMLGSEKILERLKSSIL